jgi:hypothetical protein
VDRQRTVHDVVVGHVDDGQEVGERAGGRLDRRVDLCDDGGNGRAGVLRF